MKLNENHIRSLKASLLLVERFIKEIEDELTTTSFNILEKCDGNSSIKKDFKEQIFEIRKYLQFLVNKYQIEPNTYTINQMINSRKAKMWEVLSDTTSTKLKSGGEFPAEIAQEFDAEIGYLLELIEKL